MAEAKASYMASPVRASVVNGVVTVADDGATEPDNGGASGDSGTADSGSFIEQLIAMIIDFIMNLFNFLPVGVGEVM